MNVQKTYHGKTAGQWLLNASVCESRAGRKEIFVDNGTILRYHHDGMMLETAGGPLAVLSLGPKQNVRFCELCEGRDS